MSLSPVGPLSAIIIGATGATGTVVLRELLAKPEYTSICEVGRRVSSLEGLTGTDKLTQKKVDFEKLDEAGLRDKKWDVVFITLSPSVVYFESGFRKLTTADVRLGTTRAQAGSAEAFERIDREYVVNFAKAVKSTAGDQRLVYLSSGGADAKSYFLYTRSKGLTENALAQLGYSDTIVFRPGLFQDREGGSRLGERLFTPIMSILDMFAGNRFLSPIASVGKAMVQAGTLGSAALPKEAAATKVDAGSGAHFTLLPSEGIPPLAGTP